MEKNFFKFSDFQIFIYFLGECLWSLQTDVLINTMEKNFFKFSDFQIFIYFLGERLWSLQTDVLINTMSLYCIYNLEKVIILTITFKNRYLSIFKRGGK